MTDKPNKTSLKPNKWVKENGKWVEYKCVKFYSDNKEYMSALNSSKILDNINLQYLINTLEDLLDMRNKNQFDKKTQAKMMEYIKNNSTKSLKELIKKFYKK